MATKRLTAEELERKADERAEKRMLLSSEEQFWSESVLVSLHDYDAKKAIDQADACLAAFRKRFRGAGDVLSIAKKSA